MVLKQILKILLVISSTCLYIAISVTAQGKSVASGLRDLRTIREIPQLGEVEFPSTSAQQLVQSPTPQAAPTSEVVQVTGVKANATDKGVEVILQTSLGEQLKITNRSSGNSFIADIPNAQLRLPNGDAFTFRSQKPVVRINEITVTNQDSNTIRVTVRLIQVV